MDQIEFHLQGVIITLFAVLGVIGNALCFIVLTKSTMNKLPTTTFLIGLTVADIIFLLVFVINYYLDVSLLRNVILHVGKLLVALKYQQTKFLTLICIQE